MIDGDYMFDLAWAAVTGALCLAVAVPILWWWLPEHRRSFFGTRIDPTYRLQFAYGLFGMGMFGTNVGCRVIPHGHMAYVHETFAAITALIVVTLGARVAYMLWDLRRHPRPASALNSRTA
jgi:hypothetical protein